MRAARPGLSALQRALSCPRRGDPGGCSRGADSRRARRVRSRPRADAGDREGAGTAPSPYSSRIGGSCRLLTGIGVRVWDEPGAQACRVFQGLRLGSASFLSFLCLEVLQTARRGGHLRKASIFRCRKRPRICIGHLGPAASSLRRKRNCAPVLDWGRGMDSGRWGGQRSPESDEDDS